MAIYNYGSHLEYLQAVKDNNKDALNGVEDDEFVNKNPFRWTPLHYAVAGQNYDYAKEILEVKQECLCETDKYNRTALSLAAAKGNIEIATLLLEHKIDVNVGLPMCYATSGGNKDCASALIKYGGDINEEDVYENERRYTPLTIAVIKNNLEILEFLLEQNADIDKPGYDTTALHLACQLGYFDSVKLLLSKEIDLGSQDSFFNTALDYAILNEHIDIAKYLLEKGSPVDRGHLGHTPLHNAVLISKELVAEILKYGANVNAQDNEGATALYLATYTEKNDEDVIESLLENNADPHIGATNSWTPLHMCCVTGNLKCICMLLDKLSSDGVNAVTYENITPLYLAAAHGHLKVCKALLERGAFINIKINGLSDLCSVLPYLVNPEDIKEGFDAREIAGEKGHPAIVEMFNEYQETNIEVIDIINCVKQNNLDEISDYPMEETDLLGWTCLHHAVQTGDYNLVNECIKNGANVNAEDKYGRTTIAVAAKKGKLDILELLIANGGDPNLGLPLFYAIDSNQVDCVKFLLDNGADINKQDRKKQTPLIYAVSENNPCLVKELIERNADISLRNEDENTPVHIASLYGFTECVKILVDNNAEVNIQNIWKETPLTVAAATEEFETIKILLENGADVNVVDRFKESPLHLACYYNSLESVKEILKYMPNLNTMNSDEFTPLFLSIENIDIFKLLIENGADVNATLPGGWTLLHAAAFHGTLETLDELLSLNVDINALTAESISPLYLAAARGHVNIVTKLIDKGCLIDVPINNLSNDWKEDIHFVRRVPTLAGYTSLLAAVSNGHLEIVKLLQKAGASINSVTENNMNALTIAVTRSHLKIVKFFIEEGFEVVDSLKSSLLDLSKDDIMFKEQLEGYLSTLTI